MSSWAGLGVIDGRPESRAAAAESLRRAREQIRAEARARWDAADTPYAPREVPPPEIPACWVERGDPRVPRGAAELGRDARRLGWTVRYSYARGTDVGRKDWRVVDNVCVWMRRSDDWALMTYIDGQAARGLRRGDDGGMVPVAVTALRAALGLPLG